VNGVNWAKISPIDSCYTGSGNGRIPSRWWYLGEREGLSDQNYWNAGCIESDRKNFVSSVDMPPVSMGLNWWLAWIISDKSR
jgi:hypothetical protein